MNSYVMFAVFALATIVSCEPPSGYNYNRPSFGGGVSAGGNSLSSGGNYEQVAIEQGTQEGLTVDPALLEQIKQIILNEESKAGAGAGGAGGAPSTQYGAPQAQYGPPAQQQARIVGIDFENTIPAIQVAQLRAQSQEASAGGYSASSGGYPASSFGVAPSSSYGPPSRRY
ncbi:pro-resilin-like [Chironomus tepperi]|uniref:pro-resilin-like n=1 Tax=Chironomus tepperi TaxID=113505 RepID=UPI00391F87AC